VLGALDFARCPARCVVKVILMDGQNCTSTTIISIDTFQQNEFLHKRQSTHVCMLGGSKGNDLYRAEYFQ
jgi:hypothetical protein